MDWDEVRRLQRGGDNQNLQRGAIVVMMACTVFVMIIAIFVATIRDIAVQVRDDYRAVHKKEMK